MICLAALAGIAARGVARHLCDAASVDPDRRQDPARALALAQPFLACRALRHRARPDDLADPGRHAHFQIDFDFIDHDLRISTSDGAKRQFALPGNRSRAFMRRVMAALAELGIHVAIDEMPNELPDPIRFSQDTPARLLRCRRGAALLPDPGQRRSRVQAIPHRLSRQGEPGAFLLGQLRSRGDALFRPPRAAPSRRRAAICPMPLPARPIRMK